MLLNEKHPLNIYSKSWLIEKGHVKKENINNHQSGPLGPPENVDPQLYYENLSRLMSQQQQ
jgi:hypothetical protein